MKNRTSKVPSSQNDPRTETEHQIALFRWATEEIAKGHRSLENLGAIPNGMRQLRWSCMRREPWLGVRSGMPDIYYFVPSGGFNGLFIEMKAPNAKNATVLQAKCHDRLRMNGYRVEVCHGFHRAIEAILTYEQLEKHSDDSGKKDRSAFHSNGQ
jgi:hypothetical protein